MRNHLIQTRISTEELDQIQKKCDDAGMTQSTYIRSALLKHEVASIEHKREIACQIFEMISILNQMEPTEGVEKILEGAHKICRFLK